MTRDETIDPLLKLVGVEEKIHSLETTKVRYFTVSITRNVGVKDCGYKYIALNTGSELLSFITESSFLGARGCKQSVNNRPYTCKPRIQYVGAIRVW